MEAGSGGWGVESLPFGLLRHSLKVRGEPGNPKTPAQADTRHPCEATASREPRTSDDDPDPGREGFGERDGEPPQPSRPILKPFREG